MASDKLPDEIEAKLQEVSEEYKTVVTALGIVQDAAYCSSDEGARAMERAVDTASGITGRLRPVVLEAYAAGQREAIALCLKHRVAKFSLVGWLGLCVECSKAQGEPFDLETEEDYAEHLRSLSPPSASAPPVGLPLTDRCLAITGKPTDSGERCTGVPTAGQVLCLEHQRMRDAKENFGIAIVPLSEFRDAPPVEVPGKVEREEPKP